MKQNGTKVTKVKNITLSFCTRFDTSSVELRYDEKRIKTTQSLIFIEFDIIRLLSITHHDCDDIIKRFNIHDASFALSIFLLSIPSLSISPSNPTFFLI